MPKPKPRVVVVVEGGVVQGVATSEDMEVTLIDWDNLPSEIAEARIFEIQDIVDNYDADSSGRQIARYLSEAHSRIRSFVDRFGVEPPAKYWEGE